MSVIVLNPTTLCQVSVKIYDEILHCMTVAAGFTLFRSARSPLSPTAAAQLRGAREPSCTDRGGQTTP